MYQKHLKHQLINPTHEQVATYAATHNVAIRNDEHPVAINVYIDGTVEFIYS